MKIINGNIHYLNTGVVLTFGNFDGMHLGHSLTISTVKKIALESNIPSAVVTFQPHPSIFFRNKKNFLLSTFRQKAEFILQHNIDYLYVIDFNQEFSQIKAHDFITKILVGGYNMKHIVTGNKCSFGHRRAGNISLLMHYSNILNYKVSTINTLTENNNIYSSTLIREQLKEGNLKETTKMLGKAYQISGKVIKGESRGVKLGFPTANINPDENMIIPKLGVYHAQLKLNDHSSYLDGIVNIGMRPTFHDITVPLVEMHIFDFNRDIYDCFVTIKLLKFIRSEKKFDSIEQLVHQINNDIFEVKKGIN